MKCPIDGTALVMADRSGVEIDYCPQCRGVWLDRGELDKIIERTLVQTAPQPVQAPPPPPQPQPGQTPWTASGEPPRQKRRESFLGELFDF